MTFSLSGASANTQTVTSGNVSGISLAAYATTVADITAAVIESIIVNVQLTRNGKNYNILTGNAFALGLGNKIGNCEWTAIGDYKSAILRFGQTINLSGNDVLAVNVTVGTTVTGLLTTVTTIEDAEIGEYIPKVAVSIVDTTRSVQEHPGGDNVSMVTVVSDVLGFDITAIQLNASGGYRQQLTTPDFYAFMAEQNDVTPTYGIFAPYIGTDIDGLTITTNNSAASGNTFIVVHSGEYEQKTIATAEAKLNIAADKVQQKIANAA